MDVSISAGGRVAKAHMQVERQRKITSMMNGLEAKKFRVTQRRIEDDKVAEINIWNRRSKEILKYSDDMKAFQKALLKRISEVKEMNRNSTGIRPLLNLGRYGGAPINQIKANIDKFRPVRNPTEKRLLRTKLLLQKGRSTGHIKTFKPSVLGDITQNILKLEKVDKKVSTKPIEVGEADENETSEVQIEENKPPQTNKVIMRRRRLVLPPLQVTRTMRPNANYHRRVAEESAMPTEEMERRTKRPVLPLIPEEHSPFDYHDESETYAKAAGNLRNTKAFYKWSFLGPHQPDLPKNYLTNTQRFWKQDDSITARHTNIVLPKIS